jgi:hypothetical protein
MGADRGVHVEIPGDAMHLLQPIHVSSVVDPGSGAFLTPGSGMAKILIRDPF